MKTIKPETTEQKEQMIHFIEQQLNKALNGYTCNLLGVSKNGTFEYRISKGGADVNCSFAVSTLDGQWIMLHFNAPINGILPELSGFFKWTPFAEKTFNKVRIIKTAILSQRQMNALARKAS